MIRREGTAAAGVGLALALTLGGCASEGPDQHSPSLAPSPPSPIVVQPYSEPQDQLLANIYAGALTASGVFAEVGTEAKRGEALSGVQKAKVDVVIDTVGDLTRYLSRKQSGNTEQQGVSPDLETAMNTLRDLANPTDLAIPDPASASDAPVVAIAQSQATAESIVTLGQLGTFSDTKAVAMGGLGTCDLASPCLQRWVVNYGLQVADYSVTDAGANTRDEILVGDLDAGVFPDSDGALAHQDVVVLQDNEQVTPVDNVVPVVSQEAAVPAVTDVLNRVSAELDSPALRDLNLSVATGAGTAAQVADAWLAVNGLA